MMNSHFNWPAKRNRIIFKFTSRGYWKWRICYITNQNAKPCDWEKIRGLKQGQTYEHVITKSDLYEGETVTYYAPFDKCDRVENYKTAWAHFEKVFNQENVVTV